MFVSLSGLLRRLKGRKDQMYMVDEFLKHYEIAKKAFDAGDNKVLAEFFSLYVN